jgi:hypothetical protein
MQAHITRNRLHVSKITMYLQTISLLDELVTQHSSGVLGCVYGMAQTKQTVLIYLPSCVSSIPVPIVRVGYRKCVNLGVTWEMICNAHLYPCA